MSHADESYFPQFPTTISEADPALAAISVPSEENFAEEVRADRLNLLWKITLVVSFIIGWTLVVLSGGHDINVIQAVVPSLILAASCLITGHLLGRDRFDSAVWVYTLGIILAIGLVTASDTHFGTQYAPFLYLLVIVAVGLLVSVRKLVAILALIFLAAFGFPNLFSDEIVLSNTTLFAMGLATVVAGLSAQVSGELYAIAEWALESYRRERHTTLALFESREALQKSFMRQSALTQQLRDTNAELEIARRLRKRPRTSAASSWPT